MKKTYKIILAILLTIGISLAFNINTVKAATATITENKTVTEGDSVTITANVTAGAWNLKLAGAGQEKGLVGQTSETSNASASTKITFTASKVGTYNFTLTGDITDYDTDATTTIDKKCTITVKEKEKEPEQVKKEEPVKEEPATPTKSSNNKLKVLGIKPNGFKFKQGTTKYYVTVPNDVDKVEVYAEKQESSQKISGTGDVNLKEGSNTVKVVCTAEDGTTKTYTMYITREKAEEIAEPINENQKEEQTTNEEEQQEEPEEEEYLIEKGIGITNFNIVAKTEKGEDLAVELLPAFTETEYEYQLAVPLNVIELQITVEAQEGTPEVEIMGNKNLVEGENLITVMVKLGEETKVYNITVNKTAEVQENALSSELIMQLAIIAAIATIILVAIIALIIMIVKSKKKTTTPTKSTIDIELENTLDLKNNNENDKEE